MKSTSAHEDVRLDRPIGLAGGVALVVGGVIGMGIYALIAAVGAQAGSALWVAFAVAIIVSAVGVAPLIQIASALPRAGGGYLYTSRLMNPLLGTLTSSWAILGGASCTAMVALGMAGYVVPYLPFDLPLRVAAVLLPLAFFGLYLFGLRLAASLQMIMAAQLIIALGIYGVVGAGANDLRFSLALPQGVGGLIMAVILCYSVCMGFQVIAEMGEEMKNARRNIPLSLLIGGSLVLVIYILVGTVFISSIPYEFDTIRSMTAPLMDTGKTFLPDFWVTFLSLGALSAGLTSFNAGAIALPRELFSQARDGVMPAFLGRIDRRTRTPLNAVGVYFAFTILLVLMGQSIDFYGVMTAVGILMMTAMIAVAGVRLPKRFPERYATAYFKISPLWLKVIAVISVVSSLGFIFLVLVELPVVGGVYAGWTLLVGVYFRFRINWLKAQGEDWQERFRRIPGHDE
ncbi:MAG: APC family permease [Desulfobacteraceae bacterium]|jgi:APA family basic amino acid/polyamine antiporter|nr:APC family permease [Desulfobacteraceae bacterium]